MDKQISIKKIIKELRTSDFHLNCQMPMDYSSGFPIMQINNGSLCLLIPYLKYKPTGVVDQTLVYPIRFTITIELPQARVVKFEDLSFHPQFGKIDFNSPIGQFRHDAIKQYNKKEYFDLRDELYSLYDRVAEFLLYRADYNAVDEERTRELLMLLVEPSELPIYEILDKDFYEKYLV